MSDEPVIREPLSNAEFCRFVAEAQEQRALADAAQAQVARLQAALKKAIRSHENLIEFVLPSRYHDEGRQIVSELRAALAEGEPSAEPGTEE